MRFNEASKIAEAIKQFDRIIPVMVNDMGQIALNHFNKSFRDQGFTDVSTTRWQRRKRLDEGRAILVKSGRLRRSLRKRNKGKYAVSIISDVPYSGVHNEGLRAGRGSGFKMPKRQFVGNSTVMSNKIKQKINMRIRSVFKK